MYIRFCQHFEIKIFAKILNNVAKFKKDSIKILNFRETFTEILTKPSEPQH